MRHAELSRDCLVDFTQNARFLGVVEYSPVVSFDFAGYHDISILK